MVFQKGALAAGCGLAPFSLFSRGDVLDCPQLFVRKVTEEDSYFQNVYRKKIEERDDDDDDIHDDDNE